MIYIHTGGTAVSSGSIDPNIGNRASELDKGIRAIEDALPLLSLMKVDVSALKSLIEEGKDALISGSIERMSTTAKRCSEELEHAQSEAITVGLEIINRHVSAAKVMGVDVSGMSLVFQNINESMKIHDYRQTFEAIRTYIIAIEKLLTTRVSNEINDARNQTRSAETITDLSSARELIRSAVASAQSRDFEKAFRSALEVKNTVKKALEGEARNIFGYAMEKVRDLKSAGGNLEVLDTMLTDANNAIAVENWKVVMELSDKILEEFEKLQPKLASDIFLSAKIAIVDVRKIGMETKDLLEMLKLAKNAIEAGDYKAAIRHSTDVKKECEKKMGVYRGATQVLSAVSSLVSDAKRLNIDVTKIIQRILTAKKAFETGDYKGATDIGGECKKVLLDQIKAKSTPISGASSITPQLGTRPSMAATLKPEPVEPEKPDIDDIERLKERHHQAVSLFKRMKSLGTKPDQLEPLLAKAANLLDAGKTLESATILNQCQDLMKPEVADLLVKVSADVEVISNIISSNEAELTEIRRSIHAVHDELGSDKIARAMTLLNACMDEVENLVHKQIVEKLQQLDAFTRDIAKTENDIIGMTSQMMATSTFHKFDYKSILDFVKSKKRKEEGAEQDALMKLIVNIRKNIEDAKKLGVDIREFKDTLKNIIETVRKGDLGAATKYAMDVDIRLIEIIKAIKSQPGKVII